MSAKGYCIDCSYCNISAFGRYRRPQKIKEE